MCLGKNKSHHRDGIFVYFFSSLQVLMPNRVYKPQKLKSAVRVNAKANTNNAMDNHNTWFNSKNPTTTSTADKT